MNKIQEKIDQNRRELKELERTEEELMEIRKDAKKLFADTIAGWGNSEIGLLASEAEEEFDRDNVRITAEIDECRQRLEREYILLKNEEDRIERETAEARREN